MRNFDEKNDYRVSRENMVASQIRARGVKDQAVLDAMGSVPRHLFVDEALQSQAYSDHPLPIGEKQTISQPYMVALMTAALEPKPGDIILEIGTGCGYQTAILAEMVSRVYSIERIPSLVSRARRILERLGYLNVLIKAGDGTLGWKEYAPFDGIIVTAGAPEAPQALMDQLKDGGRLVIPVGDRYSQDLIKIDRVGDSFRKNNLGGCRFVDLIGEQGWNE